MISLEYFEKAKQCGLSSFKVTNIHTNTQLNELVEKLNLECVDLLKEENNLYIGNSYVNDQKHQNGINVAVESPKCCVNYAEFNLDRKVPLRQYFGKNSKKNHNNIERISYGVGSGNTTVGGDIMTTTTRPLTRNMTIMCEKLSSMTQFKCTGKYVKNRKIKFNHVTILYYLMDNKDNNIITLKPHCDIEVTGSNKVKDGNSQEENTPTIVLSLQHDKDIDFHKRYVDEDNHFLRSDMKIVDKMKMSHGDFFVLHPHDERVFQRKIQTQKFKYKKESRKSQFQHGVVCKFTKNNQSREKKYRLSISVRFR